MKKLKIHGKKGEGQFALVDDADYQELSQYKWYLSNKNYVMRNEYKGKGKNTVVRLHRQIINAEKDQQVDHINRNPLDNRRCNLRIATASENSVNRGVFKNNTSGYKNILHIPKTGNRRESWIVFCMRNGVRKSKHNQTLEAALKTRSDWGLA